MKRYRQYKLYLLLLTLLISHGIKAQETKLAKSIDKEFKVAPNASLEITNKYGNVIIETWQENKISLKIEILAYGKDDNAAEKLMDRVEFDFKHTDDFLEVESVFDRKKSFFKDLVNAVGDYSASLLSKHKLQINYELVVPESVSSVTVDNRFGDVHLGDIKGRAKLTIAHGDLKVDRLADYSRINLNYGKIRAKEVGEANFTLKGAELEVDFAGKLNIVSSSSTLMIENALVLDLESTNDKIFFEHVRDLSGAANFTEMTVSNLSEVVRLNQSYGEMTIKSIPESFRSVRLQGKSTDYVLNFSNRSSFDSRIYARSDKLKIADFPGEREKRYMDDKSKFVQITGSFGYKNTEQRLNLDAQNGDVTIDFIEMSQETKRK